MTFTQQENQAQQAAVLAALDQYHAALQACDGQTRHDEQGTERTYRYREAVEQAVMDKIDELLRSGVLSDDVDVWLIGYWLWVEGNTRPIKETLKALGFRWHSKRVCWYWHDGRRQHAFRGGSLDDIAEVYGAEHITQQRSSSKAGAALAEVGL